MEQSILTALRSAIQKRGLTIADVAKAAKVNRTTLSLMLSGVKSPTLRTLCRVCWVLQITIKIENMKNQNGVEIPNDIVEVYGLGVSKATGLGYRFDGTSSRECGRFQTVKLTKNDIDRFIEEAEKGGDYYFDILKAMF